MIFVLRHLCGLKPECFLVDTPANRTNWPWSSSVKTARKFSTIEEARSGRMARGCPERWEILQVDYGIAWDLILCDGEPACPRDYVITTDADLTAFRAYSRWWTRSSKLAGRSSRDVAIDTLREIRSTRAGAGLSHFRTKFTLIRFVKVVK